MSRVALHTLGCKVNQYETEKIAEGFRSKGFEIVRFSDLADVYIINSCTVTQVADSKSRQAARAAMKRNSEAMVVLTGCYAETSPDQAGSIDGISLVVGNQEKDRLVDSVIALLCERVKLPSNGDVACISDSDVPQRTRALIKIQDGCDQFCSYCAVPLARPVMSVKLFDEVLEETTQLAARGFKEVVLTGIRLGLYRDGQASLPDLLQAISCEPGIERIRLSSIELTDIQPGLLDLMSVNNKICRHLHVPLQSGADSVLSRMNRPYTAEQFESFVLESLKRVPGIAITTDVIVGFPGETEAEYQWSYSFVERIRFARLHVFRYSSRSGTAAAEMQDDVPSVEKERRSGRLIELGAQCSQEFASALVGKFVSVLVEGKKLYEGKRSGLTDNYIRVILDDASDHIGKVLNVRIDDAVDGIAHGIPVPEMSGSARLD